ncbi:PREDICTED: uncharacterized protein LOC106930177 isoform X2 [Poecilia mexicana]|uniref:uncharacterized protein LOC106930177 isoform X2 n=1 Tax=Poecilia mexicana TaxID=48701 RepID=UPI00072EF0B7|nr:PREDICTED: uncharacterized protein LOC106930177 isoform X2 [Poecilia mexicana]
MDDEQKREVDFLIDSHLFKRNAFLLINKMREMATSGPKELMDEMLHSIFFLGKINCPPFSPKELFGNEIDIFNSLKEAHPKPFTLYSSQLPRRSPFSCVLDMVVHLKGQENEDEIITTMQEVVRELREIKESTISISHGNNTDKLVYLKEQMNEDTITTILQRLIKELKNTSDEESMSNEILVYRGNNTDPDSISEGQENEDTSRSTLQHLARELMDNPSNEVSYSIRISRGNNTVKVVHIKGQENENDIEATLQNHVKELMGNASKNAVSTICVSRGNSTVSVDHLKENENEDKIKTVVKELVKKLKEKPSKIALCSNTICVSHGNNSFKDFLLEGQAIEDDAEKILQELNSQLKNKTDKEYSTIFISHGNDKHSVVYLKGQENEDEFERKCQKLKHWLMENASNRVVESTIRISHGNNTVSVFHLKEKKDDIKSTLEELKHQLKKNASDTMLYFTISICHGNNTHPVINLTGGQINREQIEDEIKTTLQELEHRLMGNASYSTITVYSGNSKHSVRHYGVSMSTTGGPAGQIMVAASCLKYWEKDVADAVMSYYPKGKKYFNVTIKLPDWVRCQAFELTGSGEVKIPCRSCSNMFGLVTTATQAWPHGNCAEAESLSNLLKEKEVGVERIINKAVNRGNAVDDVKNQLRCELNKVNFVSDILFYTGLGVENVGE